jgi:polysaccharide biosynthesis/export protein
VIIDDQGNIELPLVGQIKAAGLTTSELAEHIQSNYVPRYYVRCTASVLVAQRFFYVGGEVKNPGRFLWSEDTTLDEGHQHGQRIYGLRESGQGATGPRERASADF